MNTYGAVSNVIKNVERLRKKDGTVRKDIDYLKDRSTKAQLEI